MEIFQANQGEIDCLKEIILDLILYKNTLNIMIKLWKSPGIGGWIWNADCRKFKRKLGYQVQVTFARRLCRNNKARLNPCKYFQIHLKIWILFSILSWISSLRFFSIPYDVAITQLAVSLPLWKEKVCVEGKARQTWCW